MHSGNRSECLSARTTTRQGQREMDARNSSWRWTALGMPFGTRQQQATRGTPQQAQCLRNTNRIDEKEQTIDESRP